jgi:hypothetical protein
MHEGHPASFMAGLLRKHGKVMRMTDKTKLQTPVMPGNPQPARGKPVRTHLRACYPPAGKTWNWCYKGDWYTCTRTDDLEESCVPAPGYTPPEGITCGPDGVVTL